jgi:signal peptidase
MMSTLRQYVRPVLSGAGIAVLAVWAAVLAGQFSGVVSYVLVSGTSMEPLLHTGDLAVVVRRGSYERGDVVAYRVPEGDVGAGALVIHRIVGETEDGFVYRGDNRRGIDLWQPTEDDIAGAMWFQVPNAGLALQILRAPLILGLLAAIAVFVAVLRRRPGPPAHAPAPPARRRLGPVGRLRLLLLGLVAAAAVWLVAPAAASAAGGSYRFDGGTAGERAQVDAALAASTFDWDVVPRQVTIHIQQGVRSHAVPGEVWLDSDLLRAGVFSWAIVQDEYAHQVDFLLLDRGARDRLNVALGGKAWCHADTPGLRHDDYGCERFTSTLVWAYWPSRHNAYRPKGRRDESAALAARDFRVLVDQVVGERVVALRAAA